MVRIGQFRQCRHQRTQNICEIMWVFNKTIWNENSEPQQTLNWNSVGNFYTKMKKNHSWSFSWDFFVENRYTVDQEQKKNHFHHLVWRPAPSPSHNTVSLNGEILTILWKCMTRFPILYIFAFVLSSFAFQFILKLPKWPNFNYIKLTIKNCNVLWIPL